MKVTRLTQRVLLALVCSLAIISLPLSAGAQNILKKGAQGIQKGVETGVDKTKEGAEAVGHGVKEGTEAVGHGVKKAVTGEDTSDSRMKSTEPSQATAPSQTTAPSTSSQTTRPSHTRTRGTSTATARANGEHLPATAGEFPLIALIGISALAASGTATFIRRVRAVK